MICFQLFAGAGLGLSSIHHLLVILSHLSAGPVFCGLFPHSFSDPYGVSFPRANLTPLLPEECVPAFCRVQLGLLAVWALAPRHPCPPSPSVATSSFIYLRLLCFPSGLYHLLLLCLCPCYSSLPLPFPSLSMSDCLCLQNSVTSRVMPSCWHRKPASIPITSRQVLSECFFSLYLIICSHHYPVSY